MITYNSAKNLVSYFTNIEDVVALVRVEYETNPDMGKDEMPKMTEICLIEINYYTKEMKNPPIATLEIDAFFENEEENGKCVSFDLSAFAGKNDKGKELRAKLVKEIADRISTAMEWDWAEVEK